MTITNGVTNAQRAYNFLQKTGQDTCSVDTQKFKNIQNITYQKHGENHIKKIVTRKDRKVFESVFDKSGKIQSIYAYKKPMLNWNYGNIFSFSKDFNYKKPSRTELLMKHLKTDYQNMTRKFTKTLRKIFK